MEDYKKIVRSYPNSKVAAKALYNLGLLHEENGSYLEANQVYNRLRYDYYYTDVAQNSLVRSADMYLYSGQSDSAIAIYKRLLHHFLADDIVLNNEFISQTQMTVFFKLGKAYFDEELWNESRQYLSHYLSINPEGVYIDHASLLLGTVFIALDDPKSAVTAFNKVSNSNNDFYLQAKEKGANTYFLMGDYTSAAQAYADLLGLVKDQPEESRAHAQHIISLIRSGNQKVVDMEISKFRKKFKSSLDDLASFQFELGKYYQRGKNFNTAEKFFKNVKSKYAKSDYVDDAEYYLALTNLSLNKQKEALVILTGILKKYPESDNTGAVLNTLGNIYFRSEKYESALISFKNALDKPLDAELRKQVMSNLIKTYTFVNFWDAALSLTREYIELFPAAVDIVDKKILMGRAYVNLNQIDRAVEILKETRLIADSEKEPEIQFYIGDAYFKTGQYENAIAEFVKIPFLSRKTKLQWEASALYYSGQAYEKLGRNTDAVRMYEEIVKQPGIELIFKKDAQKRIGQILQ
jgi:tetratricopeptide (TPR) repeat protein